MNLTEVGDHPTPWCVFHDEDVWIRDAKGGTVCVNIFNVEFARKVVDLANSCGAKLLHALAPMAGKS